VQKWGILGFLGGLRSTWRALIAIFLTLLDLTHLRNPIEKENIQSNIKIHPKIKKCC
jgi:hypothetical protein